MFESSNISRILLVVFQRSIAVFKSLLYAVLVGLLAAGIWLLGAGVLFEGWLYAVLFQIAFISFSRISAMSVLCRNIISYDMVELWLFASCGSGGVACVLEMGASIGFALA